MNKRTAFRQKLLIRNFNISTNIGCYKGEGNYACYKIICLKSPIEYWHKA